MGRKVLKVDGRSAYLSDTRVTVSQVISVIIESNTPYTDLHRLFPFLTLNDVALAKDYYRKHREEIDAEMGEEDV